MKHPSAEKITEMNPGGFDSSTPAEAERRATRQPAVQELYSVIEEAFAGVILGNGIGLKEADGLDDREDAATLAAYRAADEKDDWRLISPESLNNCWSSLSFFDAAGMRFHLPAYLIAELRGTFHMDMVFCLAHLSDYRKSQFTLLSAAQRCAVRRYLLHVAADHPFDRPHIDRALNEYWTDASTT